MVISGGPNMLILWAKTNGRVKGIAATGTLPMLLEYYERYGPIFTFRSLQRLVVAMIGPAANHFVTVTGAEHFSWRQGMFGEQHIHGAIGPNHKQFGRTSATGQNRDQINSRVIYPLQIFKYQ